MRRCGSEHPEDQARACDLGVGPHYDHSDPAGAWANVEVQAASARRRPAPGAGVAKAREIASAARRSSSTRLSPPSPRPPEQPEPGSPRAAVLDHLLAAAPRWVPTAELVAACGRDALGHLYDLRDRDRWPVATRQRRGRSEVWEHRLGAVGWRK